MLSPAAASCPPGSWQHRQQGQQAAGCRGCSVPAFLPPGRASEGRGRAAGGFAWGAGRPGPPRPLQRQPGALWEEGSGAGLGRGSASPGGAGVAGDSGDRAWGTRPLLRWVAAARFVLPAQPPPAVSACLGAGCPYLCRSFPEIRGARLDGSRAQRGPPPAPVCHRAARAAGTRVAPGLFVPASGSLPSGAETPGREQSCSTPTPCCLPRRAQGPHPAASTPHSPGARPATAPAKQSSRSTLGDLLQEQSQRRTGRVWGAESRFPSPRPVPSRWASCEHRAAAARRGGGRGKDARSPGTPGPLRLPCSRIAEHTARSFSWF